MASETKLQIVIDAVNNANAAFASIGRDLSAVATKTKEVTDGMKAVGAVGAVAFAGLAFATKDIIQAGAQFEQTQIAFTTMLGSATKAKDLLGELATFAKETPFQLTQVQGATKELLAFGVGMNDVIPTLRMLGDISAGVGMDKLPQLILAFGQVKAKGRLMGQELNQFSDTGVPLLAKLGEQLGVTTAQVLDMSAKGQISFAQVKTALQSLTAEGGIFHDNMKSQSASLAGQWSNLQDQITMTAITLGTALLPILKPVVEKLIEVATAVQTWSAAHPQLAAAILTVTLVLTGLMAILLPIALVLPGLVLVFTALGVAFMAVASVSGILVIATLAALYFAISNIVKIVITLRDNWDMIWLGIKVVTANAVNSVISFVEGMVNFIIAGVNKAISAINTVISAAKKVPGLGGISTIKTISAVSFGQIDTNQISIDQMQSTAAKGNTSIVNVTGNTLLSQDAATQVGNMIVNKLGLSSAI